MSNIPVARRRILGLAGVLAVCVILGLGAFAWAQGLRAYMVRTGSMSPAIRPGDLVIDQPVADRTALHVGDVITFHPQPQTTETHRVARLGPNGIVTQGDANRTPDVGSIQEAAVVGRVLLTVPYGGFVAYYFRQPTGIASLILFLLALRLAWEMLNPPEELRSTLAPPTTRRRPLAWPSEPLPETIAPRGLPGARR